VEKTETILDKKQIAMMTTTFIALLLISQLSLASAYSDKQFLFDSNYYDSLETGDLESNNTDKFTPDLIQGYSDDEQEVIHSQSVYFLTISYANNTKHSGSIRSPPHFI
jgi:hypothetical protein